MPWRLKFGRPLFGGQVNAPVIAQNARCRARLDGGFFLWVKGAGSQRATEEYGGPRRKPFHHNTAMPVNAVLPQYVISMAPGVRSLHRL